MYCNQCGGQNPDDAIYCSFCGTRCKNAPSQNQYGVPAFKDARKNWAAVTSVICGCCSFIVCGIFLSVLAVVFGSMGLSSEKRSLATAGIIIGIIGFVVTVAVIIVVYTTPFGAELLNALKEAYPAIF